MLLLDVGLATCRAPCVCGCTHTHMFNGPLSGTTWVSQYQKGKTSLDFTEARDSEWQWHQLGHMQVCTSLHTDNHASTPPLSFFTGRMPFLPPNQQRQSTEGSCVWLYICRHSSAALGAGAAVTGSRSGHTARPPHQPRDRADTGQPAYL